MPATMPAGVEVIWAERGRALVRGDVAVRDGAAARDAEPVTLEELVLAYMSRAAGTGAAPRASAAVAR